MPYTALTMRSPLPQLSQAMRNRSARVPATSQTLLTIFKTAPTIFSPALLFQMLSQVEPTDLTSLPILPMAFWKLFITVSPWVFHAFRKGFQMSASTLRTFSAHWDTPISIPRRPPSPLPEPLPLPPPELL